MEYSTVETHKQKGVLIDQMYVADSAGYEACPFMVNVEEHNVIHSVQWVSIFASLEEDAAM